jgi:hypothetical protein
MKNAPLYLARLGAISYIVWALLHFIAALSVYHLGQTMPGTTAQGRVFQDAWNLACFSISAIGVRRSRSNDAVAPIADIKSFEATITAKEHKGGTANCDVELPAHVRSNFVSPRT